MLSLELYQKFSTFVLWVPKTFSNSHRLVLKKCKNVFCKTVMWYLVILRCNMASTYILHTIYNVPKICSGMAGIRHPPPLILVNQKTAEAAPTTRHPRFSDLLLSLNCSWPCNQNLGTIFYLNHGCKIEVVV